MKFFIGITLTVAALFGMVLSAENPGQPGQAAALTPAAVTDDQVNSIASELYCPVCENVPLDVCPTQACAQWRDLIRQKLNDGWDRAQIKDYFAAQYGDRVLAEPPRRGLNWLVYILPPLFFLAGAVVVFQTLRKLKSTPKTGTPIQTPPDPDTGPYLSRLEEELRRREKD